jgi:hypothetical protein
MSIRKDGRSIEWEKGLKYVEWKYKLSDRQIRGRLRTA